MTSRDQGLAFVVGGFPLLLGPVLRDLTVYIFLFALSWSILLFSSTCILFALLYLSLSYISHFFSLTLILIPIILTPFLSVHPHPCQPSGSFSHASGSSSQALGASSQTSGASSLPQVPPARLQVPPARPQGPSAGPQGLPLRQGYRWPHTAFEHLVLFALYPFQTSRRNFEQLRICPLCTIIAFDWWCV